MVILLLGKVSQSVIHLHTHTNAILSILTAGLLIVLNIVADQVACNEQRSHTNSHTSSHSSSPVKSHINSHNCRHLHEHGMAAVHKQQVGAALNKGLQALGRGLPPQALLKALSRSLRNHVPS